MCQGPHTLSTVSCIKEQCGKADCAAEHTMRSTEVRQVGVPQLWPPR